MALSFWWTKGTAWVPGGSTQKSMQKASNTRDQHLDCMQLPASTCQTSCEYSCQCSNKLFSEYTCNHASNCSSEYPGEYSSWHSCEQSCGCQHKNLGECFCGPLADTDVKVDVEILVELSREWKPGVPWLPGCLATVLLVKWLTKKTG